MTATIPRLHRLADLPRLTPFRLTVWLGIVFLCATGALLALIYTFTNRDLTARTDAILFDNVRQFGGIPAARLPGRIAAAINGGTDRLDRYALVDRAGRIVIGNFLPPQTLAARPHNFAPTPGNPPLRALAVPLSDGSRLAIARDITQIEDLRSRILLILGISAALVIPTFAFAAVILSVPALRRVRHLTALAGRIGRGEIALQMPVSSRGDELDTIAATINTMLGEIGRLLDQVKGATDGIAHDLRTPLAQIRQRVEALRRQVASPAIPGVIHAVAVGDGLATAVGELDEVLARFTALLRISELEATDRHAGFAQVNLLALAVSVHELFEPLAEEFGITLTLTGDTGVRVAGDERLLFEALSNLVDNALKFVPAGSVVAIEISSRDDAPVLAVRDDGPGIPPSERAGVLERFGRGVASRHIPGSGLGLSLVSAIVHLHGFDLVLSDSDPGLVVEIIARPPAR